MTTTFSTLRTAMGRFGVAAALAVAAAGAQADVVYDSLSTVSPSWTGTEWYYQMQTFAPYTDTLVGSTSEAISGVGDLITLAPNTGRAITSLTVGFVKTTNTAPTTFNFTVSFYDTSKTLLSVLDSGAITLPAVGTLGGTATGSQFNITLPTTGANQFNLVDSFYYIVTVANADAGLGVLLYDYYHDTGLVGTDVGTTQDVNGDWQSLVYGTTGVGTAITTALGTENAAKLSAGFAPAIQFTTAPVSSVPEPSSFGLLALGLLGLVGVSTMSRRRA